MKLCAAYQKQLSPEMVDAYHEALADMLPQEVDLGFLEATRRSRYFPTPADIREAMYSALEKMPPKRLADPDCEKCQGSGWKEIEIKGRRYAASCECCQQKRSA